MDRYQNEVKRSFSVLDQRLADNQYLAGNYSIADIANWCWARTDNTYKWSGVPIGDCPHLARWIARIAERPAAIRGINVPERIDRYKLVEGVEKILA